MTEKEFENLLDQAAAILKNDLRAGNYHSAAAFEQRTREVMALVTENTSVAVKSDTHPHAFPDIVVNGFGIEVKSTLHDSWVATANSILETMRDKEAITIYIMYGKIGGTPDVRWARYEDCVHHVRMSHAPRFCVDLGGNADPLFKKFGISYAEFAQYEPEDKMAYVRDYARTLLKPGEKLWWLEDLDHALSLRVKRYSNLLPEEKLVMRAEAAVLCPQIVAPPRTANKYDAALHYLITQKSILAARDMFTAGSVGMKDGVRGGDHIQRQFAEIEDPMWNAFGYLTKSLFTEYWEREDIPDTQQERLKMWLTLADHHAAGTWKTPPSKILFQGRLLV